ncbi:MAG: hypothetical protein AABW58_01590 [Nanoarchaeota archaeon]
MPGRLEPADLRKTGTCFNLIGKVGQYAGLILGVYGASRATPEFGKVIIGGVCYGLFSFTEHLGNLLSYRAESELLAEKEEELGRQLGHLERKIKGRVTDAKILDPNKMPGAERLDEMVKGDLEKEIANEEKDPKKPDSGDTDKIIRSGWKKQA